MRLNKLTFTVTLLLYTSITTATIIKVPQDTPTIQAGIDSASVGDTVLVDTGRYVENINYNGKNIVVGSLFLTTGDTSYIRKTLIDGEWKNTVVIFRSGEDLTAKLIGFTITRGDGSYFTGGGGIYCSNSNPSFENLVVEGNKAGWHDDHGGGIFLENSSSRLINVTVKNNRASEGNGGGICCAESTPELVNVIVSGNRCSSKGGGIYFLRGEASLDNITVCENISSSGGGIYWYSSSSAFSSENRCNIYSNQAPLGSDLGGRSESNPITVVVDTFTVLNPTRYHVFPLENFTFDILHAKESQVEGDLYVSPDGDNANSGQSYSDPLKTISFALLKMLPDSVHPHTIYLSNGVYSPSKTGEQFPLEMMSYVSLSGESENGTILDGRLKSQVLRFRQVHEMIVKCLTVTRGSGGIMMHNSSPILKNVTISNSSAINWDTGNTRGGGMYIGNSTPSLVNVTMHGNEALDGGGIYSANSSIRLVNSILWNDSPEEIHFNWTDPNSILIAYSDIQGGETGIVNNNDIDIIYWEEGNIDTDPMFIDAENGDFHLQEVSPCINAGTSFFVWEEDTLINLPDTAYAGDAPDMGAFESPYTVGILANDFFPIEFALHQPYPNPFNPITTIEFSMPIRGHVTLTVYDLVGREVETLLNNHMDAGHHNVQWNASNLPSGVYFIRMESGNFS